MQSEHSSIKSRSLGLSSISRPKSESLEGIKSPKRVSFKMLSLAICMALTGCSYVGDSQSINEDSTTRSSTLIESQAKTQSGSAAAIKLNNLASTAKKSADSCTNGCETANTAVDNEAAVESYEDIDSEPAYISVEDEGDIDEGSISVEDDGDDNDDEIQPDRLGVEHVPLNAISPQTLQAFVEVIDVIRHDYVRPVNDEALFQQAISGMLEKLDKHAEYLSPENYDHLRSFTDGEVAQVGLLVKYDNKIHRWVVTSVLSQSSAQDKGIKVGDKLLRIKNIELTSDMAEQDIQQLLSGIAGSQVEVTVQSSVGARRNIILQRNLAADNKLTVSVKQGIAVIRLPVFQNGSKDQLINALKEIGIPITGVVLDVRNNPGGVLSSAIDIASLFIRDGNLIQVRSRTNHGQVIKSNGTPYLSDLPVVVLQNRYSASASEVLASSFKSNNRATIVGEQSFGKGTVQEVIPLDSGGGLKLTVAEYRSAKGELIDGVGVKPDVIYPHDGSDWQQQAVNLLLSKDRPFGIVFDDELGNISVIDDY